MESIREPLTLDYIPYTILTLTLAILVVFAHLNGSMSEAEQSLNIFLRNNLV